VSAHFSLATTQVERIVGLCNFLDHPAMQSALDQIPVTMPRDVGAFGFETRLWVGLGMVGLWSALDAFAERVPLHGSRCAVCGNKCLWSRLASTGKIDAASQLPLNELEDVRNLFAHNFAGQADAMYFSRTRHVVSSGVPSTFSSGATFDGAHLSFNSSHLRYYAERSRQVLNALL
jgi:hypothetical protein